MADTFQDFDTMQEFLSSDYFKQALEQFKASKKPKKEWEIVAFKHRGKIAALIEDWREGFSQPHFEYPRQMMSLSWALNPANDCAIHSVRRLSDNLIFSCQDTVGTPNNGRFVIEGFEIDGAHMLVKMGGGYLGFSAIKKLSAPILITHDGVEIFEGMEFWGIRDWRVLEGGKADKYDKNLDKAAPVFSTRSAAEEYILNHKPVLSLNDVREWVEAAIRSNLSMDFIREKAEHTVKQKLNPDNLKK